MERDDPAYKGQRDYTRLLLNAYDPVVLGPVARFVWHCPTTSLLERYRQHIRSRHLDVGPGTGYFLERSGLPEEGLRAILAASFEHVELETIGSAVLFATTDPRTGGSP